MRSNLPDRRSPFSLTGVHRKLALLGLVLGLLSSAGAVVPWLVQVVVYAGQLWWLLLWPLIVGLVVVVLVMGAVRLVRVRHKRWWS